MAQPANEHLREQPGYLCQRKLNKHPYGQVGVFDTTADDYGTSGFLRYSLVWYPRTETDHRDPHEINYSNSINEVREAMRQCAFHQHKFEEIFWDIEPGEDWSD